MMENLRILKITLFSLTLKLLSDLIAKQVNDYNEIKFVLEQRFQLLGQEYNQHLDPTSDIVGGTKKSPSLITVMLFGGYDAWPFLESHMMLKKFTSLTNSYMVWETRN